MEVCLKLCTLDHTRMVHEMLEGLGLDTVEISGVTSQENIEFPATLSLKRSFSSTSMAGKTGLKSICYINNKQVPLKALKALGAPLLPVVNAQLAANALGRPSARRAMIDAGVPSEILRRVSDLTKQFRRRRRERELLEQDLATRYLPVSMTGSGDGDEGLLRHWTQELDAFEKRIMDLLCSLRIDTTYRESEIAMLLGELGTLHWMSVEDSKLGFCSRVYVTLCNLMEKLEDLDRKVEQATTSLDMIGSLSCPNSAITALERARRLLVDVGGGMLGHGSKLSLATERAHELVNDIENSLSDCVDFLNDEHDGLLATVKNERNLCPISSEALDEYILEWKNFSRKHGISPYALPLCHRSLRQELDGTIEAKVLLPNAIVAEEKALHALKEACDELRSTRREIAGRLSRAVSARLPSLGMDLPVRFIVRVQASESPQCGLGVGADEVDFFLVHEEKFHDRVGDLPREGKIEAVASSGEKARIILAIECEVPGSIRALCGSSGGASQSSTTDEPYPSLMKRPVAVIYDEIDAHVGGLASVSIAQMLSQQSLAYQVVSITHSASVAATANMHIRVKRLGNDGHTEISATQVLGEARLKELARMASGDMAAEEAQAFAVALLRDARDSHRETN